MKSKIKAYKGRKVAFSLGESGPKDSGNLGGKGAGLVKLAGLGMPVPEAFTISTSVARAYAQHQVVPRRLQLQMQWGIQALEKAAGKCFGDASDPLTVSVRSGAAVSMPGMMDTVLNLGLNRTNVEALAKRYGRIFAYDCYRRFLSMFGEVVLGLPKYDFESVLRGFQAGYDGNYSGSQLESICRSFLYIITERHGKVVPTEPFEQLEMAVEAVLRSWNNPRAVEYRRHNKVSSNLGTAVNVQVMVFGNRDEQSCTGVVFSRNSSTGERGLWGEFLLKAQGEDLVAGHRSGLPISAMAELFPAVYSQLDGYVQRLESEYDKPVDVEFTVESGRLYILQVRPAKQSPEASATTAVNFVFEKRWTKAQALASVSDEAVEVLQSKGFEPESLALKTVSDLAVKGLPASPGAAVGRVVLTAEAAVQAAASGEPVVLVRPDTSPDDLKGMIVACAIVTANGGATSHAAVVARGLGKPAVVGCGDISRLEEGELVSVDGGSGVVIHGEVVLIEVPRKKEVNIFLRWHQAQELQSGMGGLLNFEYYEQSVSFNDALNDFYLVDAMAAAACGTALSHKCSSLKQRVQQEVADRLVMYLVVAVGGELRHGPGEWDAKSAEVQELRGRFAIQVGGNRRQAQCKTLQVLQGMKHQDHVEFTRLCARAFEGGSWGRDFSPLFGGKAWANIAWAAYHYLSGAYNAAVFGDHAFDLEHNGGSVFGKNRMLTGDRYAVKRQLDWKKKAESLSQLHSGLSGWGIFSAEVLNLYKEGQRLGIF